MMPSIDMIVNSLHKNGFEVLTLATGLMDNVAKQPMITFDHRSYPGVEAHVFTAADGAFWIPKLDENGDVIVIYSLSTNEDEHLHAWERLLGNLEKIAKLLHTYRKRVLGGSVPGTIWAHHDTEWYRELRKAPYHEKLSTDTFIDYVDPSIRSHVVALNNYGFDTIESCSGLLQDHLDRDPYRPYVMLDERAYSGCIPHFFTLADIADWIPSYAPHNFDVYIRIQRNHPIEEAWNNLVQSAKALDPILSPYRKTIRRIPSCMDELDILRDPLGMSLVNK